MRVIESQEGSGVPMKDQEHQLSLAAFEADQGRIVDAIKRLGMVRSEAALTGDLDLRFEGAALSLRSFAPDAAYDTDLQAYEANLTKQFADANEARRGDLAFAMLAGARLLARQGDSKLAQDAIQATESYVGSAGQPILSAMLAVAKAELALDQGDPGAAVDALALGMESHRMTYQGHSVLMRALVGKGDTVGALREARWLTAHRGAAYGEFGVDYMLQASNVVESDLALLVAQRLATVAGDADDAERDGVAFRAAWGDAADGAAASNRLKELKL
jgi:hypothetical protein